MELLKIKDLILMLGLSRDKINRMRKTGKFPAPFTPALPALRWRKAVIDAWLKGDTK